MDLLLEILGVCLAGIAAFFAWKSHYRRPKLKLYPILSPRDGEPQITYWSEDDHIRVVA